MCVWPQPALPCPAHPQQVTTEEPWLPLLIPGSSALELTAAVPRQPASQESIPRREHGSLFTQRVPYVLASGFTVALSTNGCHLNGRRHMSSPSALWSL